MLWSVDVDVQAKPKAYLEIQKEKSHQCGTVVASYS